MIDRGEEPDGLRRRYSGEDELPGYVLIFRTLLMISERGRL
jgi:hypothetical protein